MSQRTIRRESDERRYIHERYSTTGASSHRQNVNHSNAPRVVKRKKQFSLFCQAVSPKVRVSRGNFMNRVRRHTTATGARLSKTGVISWSINQLLIQSWGRGFVVLSLNFGENLSIKQRIKYKRWFT